MLNIFWMVFGIGLMLVLNLKFKINSMATLPVAALPVGILAGMNLMSLLHTMKVSFGNTLGELAIIVVFDAVIGKLMVDSDTAHQITYTLLARLDPRYVQLSVITIGLIFGLTMFHEVAFITLAPPVIVIAVEAKVPFLKLAISTVTVTTTARSLFPSQPGSVALVNVYGADMGVIHIHGILVAIPSVICAGLTLSKFLGDLERPTPSSLKTDQPVDMNSLSSFGVSILASLIPAVITISTTTANIWLVEDTPAWEVADFIGSSPIAILIVTVVALVLFGTVRGHDMQWVMNALESVVESITMVILIIDADGVLKQTIIDIDIGDAIGMSVPHDNISPYITAWPIITLIRPATGQDVVSAMTAAGIISTAILDPATGQLVGVNPAPLVLAAAASPNILTHINDTPFRLFKGYFDLSVKDTLKARGLLEPANSVIGFIIVLIISTVT